MKIIFTGETNNLLVNGREYKVCGVVNMCGNDMLEVKVSDNLKVTVDIPDVCMVGSAKFVWKENVCGEDRFDSASPGDEEVIKNIGCYVSEAGYIYLSLLTENGTYVYDNETMKIVFEDSCTRKVKINGVYKYFKNTSMEGNPNNFKYVTLGVSKPVTSGRITKILKDGLYQSKISAANCGIEEMVDHFYVDGEWIHEDSIVNEELVVYKALYDNRIWSKEINEFLSPVPEGDKSIQKYMYEEI